MDDPLGLVRQTIGGRYRLDAIVGQGGFGVVYRAVQVKLGVIRAVKVLNLPSLPKSIRAGFLKDFLEEGKRQYDVSASRPDLAFVHVVDTGEVVVGHDTLPYLVLEWLNGRSLADDLAERLGKHHGRSLEDAMALLEPIAIALAHVHEKGIAHRDVKPHNIFLATVTHGIRATLLDFGVAKEMPPTKEEAMTATAGVAPVTPLYSAPEQWSPSLFGASGPWTDVYAFALVLVELLTDKYALTGATRTQLELATQNELDRPTPRNRGVHVVDAVENVFAKAFSLHARDRYQDLGAFWSALRSAIARAPTEPKESSAASPVEPVAAPIEPVAPAVEPAASDVELGASEAPESVAKSGAKEVVENEKVVPRSSSTIERGAKEKTERRARSRAYVGVALFAFVALIAVVIYIGRRSPDGGSASAATSQPTATTAVTAVFEEPAPSGSATEAATATAKPTAAPTAIADATSEKPANQTPTGASGGNRKPIGGGGKKPTKTPVEETSSGTGATTGGVGMPPQEPTGGATGGGSGGATGSTEKAPTTKSNIKDTTL